MQRMMINASVTMGQFQKRLDSIGHNLANSDTVGYKSRESSFQELLFQEFNNQPKPNREVGRQTPLQIRQGVGAKVSETNINMGQGSLKNTDRPLDVAILAEDQFFQVGVPNANGEMQNRFTRNGQLYVSPINPDDPKSDVYLVNADGYHLIGENGPIIINNEITDINISNNGTITGENKDGITVNVGQLEMVQVIRPQMLINEGDNLYRFPDLQQLNLANNDVFRVLNTGEINVQSRYLESSNVDMAQEMTEMMVTQRAYQFNAKSITMADQMLGLINSVRS